MSYEVTYEICWKIIPEQSTTYQTEQIAVLGSTPRQVKGTRISFFVYLSSEISFLSVLWSSYGAQRCLGSPRTVRQMRQKWLQLWILMCAYIHSSIKLFYGDIITLNMGRIGNRELAILSGLSIVK